MYHNYIQIDVTYVYTLYVKSKDIEHLILFISIH